MSAQFYRTIETNTEPAFVITNNYDEPSKGTALIWTYFFTGDEDSAIAPIPKLDDDGVVLLDQEGIKSLIAALQEFVLPEEQGE